MNQILIESKKLVCNDGEVWLWKSENMGGVRHFATKEDAQKYIDLHHQFSREKGMKVESYSIGTEDDFMAAAKKFTASMLSEFQAHTLPSLQISFIASINIWFIMLNFICVL